MGGCRCQLHVCPSVTGHHAVGMLMTQEGCIRLVTVAGALGIIPFLCYFTAIHEMFMSKMCLDLCPSYPNVPQGHGSCPLFPVSCSFWKIPVSERRTPPNMLCASGKPPGSSACPAGCQQFPWSPAHYTCGPGLGRLQNRVAVPQDLPRHSCLVVVARLPSSVPSISLLG